MKKTKLLTGLTALCLVLSLGACSETSDEIVDEGEKETPSSSTSSSTPTVEELDDTKKAINYITSRKTKNDINNWTGVYSTWDISDKLYIKEDGEYVSYEDGAVDTIEKDVIYASTIDGTLYGLDTVEYTEDLEETNYEEYYDGSTIYLKVMDEISTETNTTRTLSYYTQDLVDYIEDSNSVMAWIEDDYNYPYYGDWYDGYVQMTDVKGNMETDEEGNTTVEFTDKFTCSYSYDYIDIDYDLKVKFVYDSDDKLSYFYCSYEEVLQYYEDWETYHEEYKSYVMYQPYTGSVDVPYWVTTDQELNL